MNAVFINKKLNKEEIKFISKFSVSDVFIYYTNELPAELKKYKSEKPEIEPSKAKFINSNTFKDVLSFGNLNIKGKILGEYLSYHNFNLFYYHKFRLYFYLRNLNYEKVYLKYILNKNHDKIYLFGIGKPNDYSKPDLFEFPHIKEKRKGKLKMYFNLFILFFLRTFKGLFQKHKIRKHTINYIYSEFTIIDPVTLKEKTGNVTEYLNKNLNDDFVYFSDIYTENIKNRFLTLQKRYFSGKRSIFFEAVVFKALFNFSILKKFFQIRKSLHSGLSDIEKNDLKENHKILFNELIRLKSSTDFYLFRYLSAENFFNKNKDKIQNISSFDENSPNNKIILDAAKFNGITTIGIQHGAIHDLHPAYIYTEKDNVKKILTDFTLLWGEMWKKLLTEKGNYPAESLFVSGNLRTDIIPLINKNILPVSGEKTILFATQPQRNEKLRYQNAYDVFSVMKKFPEIKLIIKPHQNEKDLSYYKNIIKETDIKNYIINTKNDLYLLINSSDAVIVSFSTVGLEALFFKKPLIVLDYLKEDIQGYIKSGVGFEANNSDEIFNLIKLLSEDKLKINEKKVNEFVNQRVYKTDGNTGKRIADFIKNAKSIN